MYYEIFFWIMLAVVFCASASGVLVGIYSSLRTALALCALLAFVAAFTVVAVLDYAGMHEGHMLSAIATFLFFLVIASAFALLMRRVRAGQSPSRF